MKCFIKKKKSRYSNSCKPIRYSHCYFILHFLINWYCCTFFYDTLYILQPFMKHLITYSEGESNTKTVKGSVGDG